MPTPRDQLQQWLEEPEGIHLEFKEAKNNFHFEKLVDYCVALANEGGGKILLGVTDRRPRHICGTTAFAEPGRTEAGLHDRLSHRIPVEELRTPEGRVLVVHVPPRLPGTAWQIGGRYFKRAGDDLAPMSADELRAIFAEGAPDFSASPCPGATLASLSPEALATFRALWAKKTGDPRKLAWTDLETLTNAELVVDGQITYAALILLGTHAAMGRYLAQAELVFEYRSSESAGPAADRVEHREGFLLWMDALWTRINLRNDRQSYQDGFVLWDILTFDEVSVREAVLNAVAHRDYRLAPSVFVRQYAKRLEIVSPGGLPPGITLDNILDQQSPRNRRLAEALARCGLVERAGQGTNRMFENAIRQGKALPNFTGSAAHEVRLTLEGSLKRPELVKFIERLTEETLRSFSTQDFLALDFLNRDQPLPEPLKARMPGLIAAGVVESIGRGKGIQYILSRDLHHAMHDAGTYTRKRGLDHETKKALLVQHLRGEGTAGAAISDLQQVLPADSRRSIQRFLDELRAEGVIGILGQNRWARWVLVAHIGQDP